MFRSRSLLGQVVIEWRWRSWYARNLHLTLGAAERKSVACSSPFTLEEPCITFAARKAQFPHRVKFQDRESINKRRRDRYAQRTLQERENDKARRRKKRAEQSEEERAQVNEQRRRLRDEQSEEER